MAPSAPTGSTSDPTVVTVEVLQPVPYGQYNVNVAAIAAPPAAANAAVTVNGEAPPDLTVAGNLITLPGVRLRAIGRGTATVTVGPSSDSPITQSVLLWAKNLLRLQLWIGAGLIFGGGLFVFSTLRLSHPNLTFTSGPTPPAASATTTSLKVPGSTTTSTATPGGPAALPPAAGSGGSTTAASITVVANSTTIAAPAGGQIGAPGGATSSDTSLVQTVALAMITAGATLIPTGAASILAGKVKTQD